MLVGELQEKELIIVASVSSKHRIILGMCFMLISGVPDSEITSAHMLLCSYALMEKHGFATFAFLVIVYCTWVSLLNSQSVNCLMLSE